jgi:PAS domain S-box-containing protein
MKLSNKYFATLLDNISEAIIVTDKTHKIVHINRAAVQVFGYRVEEILGRPLELLLPERFVETHRQHMRKLIEPQTIVMIKDRPELVAKRKDESEFPVEIGTSKIAEGGEEFFTAIVVDITERKHAADTLRESEEKFHALIEHSSDPIVLVDAEGIVFFASPAISRILGYSFQELLNKPVPWMIHPDERDQIREFLVQLASEPGSTQTVECRLQHKDGTWCWIEAVSTNLLNLPAVRAIVINWKDITERKQAEKVLRESEEKFHALIEHSSDAIATVDAQGRVLYRSSAARRILGFSKGERLGQNILNWVHPDDIEHARQAFDRLVSEPGSTHTALGRLKHEDGRWHWVEAVGTNLLNLPAVRAIVINWRDVTQRKQAEDALREQERQLIALVTSLDDLVFEIDEQGTYRQVWTAKEGLLLWPKSQLPGKRLVDVWGEERGRFLEGAVQRALASGNPETLEYPLDLPIGHRWFMARANPILVPGESPHSAVVLVRDITDRKKAEAKIQEQLERLTALREVDQVIASTFDVQMSLNILLSRAVQLLAVDAAAVLLLDPVQNVLEYRIGIGFRTNVIQNASVRIGTNLAGRVALERRMVETRNISNEPGNQLLTDLLRRESFVSYHGAPLLVKGNVIGVLEVFSRSFIERDRDWLDFFSTLAVQAAIMIDRAQLFNDLQTLNAELIFAYDATIEGWSRALDLRDKETEGHTQRVTKLTMQLAQQMGIPDNELIHIRRGALLHDIGKLGVPDHILLKPEALTEPEWKIMKKHPIFAYELLSPIRYLKSAAIDIPYCHHEKWDGTGYPRGLKGEQIPLAARIFAIVNVWDALTSDRQYRKAWSKKKTQAYLSEQAGKSFDPKVVEAFLELLAAERASSG